MPFPAATAGRASGERMSTDRPRTGALPSPPRPSWRARCRRAAWRIGRLLVVTYLGLMIVLSVFQARLIFPGAASQGTPGAVVEPRQGVELVRLETAAGVPVTALFAPALTAQGSPRSDAPERPTLLFFYGNGMSLKDTEPLVEDFRRLGANVLAADYLGFGMSGGRAGEPGCYETADAVYDHLVTRRDIDPHRIVAAGWSLGGAVAIDLAARRPVAGLAVFSTFTSMTEMARRHYPFLPTSLLLRHRFESLTKIRGIRCPILVGHGRDDQLVPHAMSERLAEAAGGPVTTFTLPGTGHGDFFDAGGPVVYDHLARFLEGLVRPKATEPAR